MSDKRVELLFIIARTALRCERLLLRLGDMDERRVLAHNDECVRLNGVMEELR